MHLAETYEDLRPLLFSIAYRMLGSVARGRGHRPGGVPALPPRAARAAGGDRLAEGVPVGGRRRASPSTSSARRACGKRRTSASGCPSRCSPTRALPTPRRTPRTPTRSRWRSCSCSSGSRPSSAPSSSSTTSSTTTTTRSPGSSARARTTRRQLAVRARRHVEENRPRFEASRRERERLADRFFDAVEDGDMDGLVELLADDVVVYGDGGGTSRRGAGRSSDATRCCA